jgi:hypothetical protein
MKIRMNLLNLMINSFLTVLIAILFINFIEHPNLIEGSIILIFLAIIFRNKIK